MKRLDEARPCARAHVPARSRMTRAVAPVTASALGKKPERQRIAEGARELLVAEKSSARQRDPIVSPIEVDGGGVAATDDDADAFC
jgi:hypothetical protein